MKKFIKVLTITLTSAIIIAPLAGCASYEEHQIEGVEITQEEIDIIETMQSEGHDDLEIAETLASIEKTEETSETSQPSDDPEFAPEAVTSSTISNQTTSARGTSSNSSSGSTRIPGGISISCTPTASEKQNSPSPTPAARQEEPEDEYIPTDTKPASVYEFKRSIEDECIELINGLRKAEAVRLKCVFYVPITRSGSEADWDKAHTRCKEIITDWSHKSASGSGLGSECIYQAGGEVDASAIVYCWKNSPGHYALLMGGCTSRAGLSSIDAVVGVLYFNGKTYACYGQIKSNYGYSPDSGYTDPDQCHHSWVTIGQRVKYSVNLVDVRECEYCHEIIEVFVGSCTPTPIPEQTKPTETQPPEEPEDNGCDHDWEYTGGNDEYDYFRCRNCGATYSERYTDYPTSATEPSAAETQPAEPAVESHPETQEGK